MIGPSSCSERTRVLGSPRYQGAPCWSGHLRVVVVARVYQPLLLPGAATASRRRGRGSAPTKAKEVCQEDQEEEPDFLIVKVQNFDQSSFKDV